MWMCLGRGGAGGGGGVLVEMIAQGVDAFVVSLKIHDTVDTFEPTENHQRDDLFVRRGWFRPPPRAAFHVCGVGSWTEPAAEDFLEEFEDEGCVADFILVVGAHDGDFFAPGTDADAADGFALGAC